MFGNRKRFLRDGDVIVNLDQVQMLQYEPTAKKICFWFSEDECHSMCDKTPADFEKIVRAIKRERA
jgi:hypothetical protein